MERRYLRNGVVAHALMASDSRRTECGLELWWCEEWFGTGSQEEYEENARRRQCKSCVKKVGVNW